MPLNATLGFKASPVNGLWFNIFGGYRISKDELFCNLVDADEMCIIDSHSSVPSRSVYIPHPDHNRSWKDD